MSDNILEVVVNSFCNAISTMFEIIFNNTNSKDTFDIEQFFYVCNLKNSLNEYTKLYKKTCLNDEITYYMTIPAALSLKDFEKHKDALIQYINRDISMSYENSLIVIKSTEKKAELQEFYKYENLKRSLKIDDDIEIQLGYSQNCIESIHLKENPHTLLTGATGTGKSVCLKSMLTYLISNYNKDELSLILCDLKCVELSLFKNCDIVESFTTEINDVTNTIKNLLDEVQERYKIFEKENVTCIQNYNKKFKNKKMKYKILVIEEIVNLLQDNKKRAMKMLKILLSISRSSGVYVILTMQRASNDVLDVVVRANISNRIVFRTESPKDSVIALDEEGAENLDIQGRGILKVGSKKVIFQGFYISDNEVRTLINKHLKTESNTIESTNKQNSNKIINCKKRHSLKNATEEESARNVKDISFLDRL